MSLELELSRLGLVLAEACAAYLPELDLEGDEPEPITEPGIALALMATIGPAMLASAAAHLTELRLERWEGHRAERELQRLRAEVIFLRSLLSEIGPELERLVVDGLIPASTLVRVGPDPSSGYAGTLRPEKPANGTSSTLAESPPGGAPSSGPLEPSESSGSEVPSIDPGASLSADPDDDIPHKPEPEPELKRSSFVTQVAKRPPRTLSLTELKQCRVDGCRASLQQRGLCSRHHRQAKLAGIVSSVGPGRGIRTPPLSESELQTIRELGEADTGTRERERGHHRAIKGTCTEPGCSHVVNARGLCVKHHKERRAAGTLPPKGTPGGGRKPTGHRTVNLRECSEKGCMSLENSRGLCKRHYRIRSEAGTLPPRKASKGGSKLKTEGGRRCGLPGCTRAHDRRGICAGHSSQITRRARLGPLRSPDWRSHKPPELCPVPGCPHRPAGEWRWCTEHETIAAALDWRSPQIYDGGTGRSVKLTPAVGSVGEALRDARAARAPAPPPPPKREPPPPEPGRCLVKGCAHASKLHDLCSTHLDQLRFRRPDKALSRELKHRPELSELELSRSTRLGVSRAKSRK